MEVMSGGPSSVRLRGPLKGGEKEMEREIRRNRKLKAVECAQEPL